MAKSKPLKNQAIPERAEWKMARDGAGLDVEFGEAMSESETGRLMINS